MKSSLKRAFLYIARKKVRTLLLCAFYIVVFIFMLSALVIYADTTESIDVFKRSLGTGFNVEVNIDRDDPSVQEAILNEEGRIIGVRYLTPVAMNDELLETIASVDEIDAYNAQVSYFSHTDLNVKQGEMARICENIPLYPDQMRYEGDIEGTEILAHYVGLLGCTNSELHTFFQNGALSLTDGRHIVEGDEWKVVISSYIAEANNLKVGDIMPLNISSEEIEYIYAGAKYEPIEYNAEIVGIFDVNFDYGTSEYTYEKNIPENLVFMDTTGVKEILMHRGDPVVYDRIAYFVDDPSDLDSAIYAAKQTDLPWQHLKITRDKTSFEAYTAPLITLSNMSMLLLVLSAGTCFVVVMLIAIMTAKNRQKEIYILRALGINKKDILKQIIFENFVLIIAAFVIALTFANVFVNNIGEIFELIILPPGNSDSDFIINFDDRMYTVIEPVIKAEVDLAYSLTPLALIIAGGIGFGSMLIAVLASSKRILNKPLCNLKNEIR